MADGPTCGDFGGTKVDGEPCGRPAGWGTDSDEGRCTDHPAEGPFSQIHHPKKRAFLAAYAESGNKTRAAEDAGIDRSTPYTDQWAEDEDFQRALAVAENMAADALEAEARRRAVEGVREPRFTAHGEVAGHVRKYSDTLLIFLLKGARPRKFADFQKIGGPEGEPITPRLYLPEKGSGPSPDD